MVDALYIAASGLMADQQQIDVISNNVANLQTPGFKGSRVAFSDVASATRAQVEQGQSVDATGAGSAILTTQPSFSEGSLQQTGNTYDLAIHGPGFFEVTDADGNTLYTRDGQFHLDDQGHLVTATGLRVDTDLQVPPDATNVKIDLQGNVSATLGSDQGPTALGRLSLVTFPAPDGLRSVGTDAYAPTPQSGVPSVGHPGDDGFGQIQQGALEGSNVDMVSEMSALVIAQRAYQLNARLIQAADQILDTINNLQR